MANTNNVDVNILVIYTLFLSHTCSELVIERQQHDVILTTSTSECTQQNGQYISNNDTCVCDTDASTVSGNSGETPTCLSQVALGCDIVLENHVVEGGQYNEKINVLLNDRCKRISDVFIWNTLNARSHWIKITDTASELFNISSDSHLTADLDTDQWKGQVIKLVFPCDGRCVILKVSGSVAYPFDVKLLRSDDPTGSRTGGGKNTDQNKDKQWMKLGVIIAIVVIMLLLCVVVSVAAYVCNRNLACCNKNSKVKGEKGKERDDEDLEV